MSTKTKSKTAAESTAALSVQSTSGFAVLANNSFAELVSDELDGLDLSLERVKIPAGGSTAYELPTEGDEPEMVKEFSGIIIHQHALNAYYTTRYTGGSSPPDCGSYDGKVGKGNPGGNCAACPLNQYGSDENGIAKGCKNKRRLYILREGEIFPLLLTLPTGSLKSFTKYLKTQLSKGRTSGTIVTRFSLKKAVNNGGIAYSQAVFNFDRELTLEEIAIIKPLSEQIKAYASNVGFDDVLDADSAGGEEIEPLGR